ncbi:MAG: phytanoyl-CoA dioxygenase family protein [Ginsengibacter sp.]
MIRRFKFLYAFYNFFQKKKLLHNIPVYKKLGLKKKYYSSVSSKDFVNCGAVGEEKKIKTISENTAIFKRLDSDSQQSILNFEMLGYARIGNYLSGKQTDVINAEIDKLLQQGKIKFNEKQKIMFAIHHSEALREVANDPDLLELLRSLIGGDVQLFQSINFFKGSEQKTHSDSIHMTTYPTGGLLGIWIALEDIDSDNGPLHYYPGSQKLPYYFNADYDNEGSRFLLGEKDYSAYESMLENKVQDNQMEKKIFTAKKGDLLIWHANLLHGGEPHINKEKTRKSVVFHYYNTECVCYHEITQRPALIG